MISNLTVCDALNCSLSALNCYKWKEDSNNCGGGGAVILHFLLIRICKVYVLSRDISTLGAAKWPLAPETNINVKEIRRDTNNNVKIFQECQSVHALDYPNQTNSLFPFFFVLFSSFLEFWLSLGRIKPSSQ